MKKLIIGVAGPYSAPTAAGRQKNLDRLNEWGALVLQKGHIPLIGINAALPVVDQANPENRYKALMEISMAVMDHCDALLMTGESAGANRERDLISAKGLPVYYRIEDIP